MTFDNPTMQDFFKKWCQFKNVYEKEKAEILAIEDEDKKQEELNKLYSIQGEGFRVLTFLHDNKIRGDSHEDEQDAPHHREEPHGRRQWRLIHCFKGFHAVFGNPGGESAYRQRDGNGSDEIFPVNIMKSVGELHGSLL